MCIKEDTWIHARSNFIVDPFESEQVNAASYDLRLSHQFINLTSGEHFSAKSLRIVPGMAYLASTIERIKMPMDVAGLMCLKSSLARQGLDHSLAGWVDPNFSGTLTMELHTHRDIVIYAGQRVAQIVFQSMENRPLKPYVGRYQHQVGPTEARDDDKIAVPINDYAVIRGGEDATIPETETAGKIIKSISGIRSCNGCKEYKVRFDPILEKLTQLQNIISHKL